MIEMRCPQCRGDVLWLWSKAGSWVLITLHGAVRRCTTGRRGSATLEQVEAAIGVQPLHPCRESAGAARVVRYEIQEPPFTALPAEGSYKPLRASCPA